jgi:SAM-dependent methyltransferase
MTSSYLLSGHVSELERLQLQSRVWEPAGRELLALLRAPRSARALDVGCGVMGWLRNLSSWVGRDGTVIGTDVDEKMLSIAREFVVAERLDNVSVVHDDLFVTQLEPASFDLVHARFQIAPLGRQDPQMATYRKLLRPGGVLVLEDPDSGSWHFNPPAPAAERLIALIEQSFRSGGGDFNAGRQQRALLQANDFEASVRTHVIALEPGHPYLKLPIQFATALRGRIEQIVPRTELEGLMQQAETEIAAPDRWGTTFTLVQTWGVRA